MPQSNRRWTEGHGRRFPRCRGDAGHPSGKRNQDRLDGAPSVSDCFLAKACFAPPGHSIRLKNPRTIRAGNPALGQIRSRWGLNALPQTGSGGCITRAGVFACGNHAAVAKMAAGRRRGKHDGLPALRSDSAGRQAILRGLRGAAAVALRGVWRRQPGRQPLLRRLRRSGRKQRQHPRTGRAAGAAGSGAPPAHCHVLRPCRFDRARRAPRPRRPARGDRRLPSLRHRRGHPRRRLRCPLHGRRRAGLFRLSEGARDQCRACGAGRIGGGRGDHPACDNGWPARDTGDPHRHRHRPCRRRRPDRRRRLARRGGGRRYPQPRQPAADAGRTEHRADRRLDEAAHRRAVRIPSAGRRCRPWLRRADPGLAGAARSGDRQPVRGVARRRTHSVVRPRRRACIAGAPLGTGTRRRRPRGAAERRSGHRQVAPERGAGRAIARRTASAAALVLRAALPGHRAASGHFELCATRRLRARRRPDHQAGETRGAPGAHRDPSRRTSP